MSHIEPYERELTVRYRIDGVAPARPTSPPTINRFGAAIISRLKIMANLNIAEENASPRTARITFRYRNPRTAAGPLRGRRPSSTCRRSPSSRCSLARAWSSAS